MKEKRINECPFWDEFWGCSTSPELRCDDCRDARWKFVKEDEGSKNILEKYLILREEINKKVTELNDLSSKITEAAAKYVEERFDEGNLIFWRHSDGNDKNEVMLLDIQLGDENRFIQMKVNINEIMKN